MRDLYFKLEKSNSKEAKEAQQQKLKDITQKHAKLRLRIDEQLRTLMKSYQPELSNEEKEWIDKLEKLSKQVSGESGYLARVKKVCICFLSITNMILIPCPLILVERAAGTTITSNKTQGTQICWHESNSTQECSWYIETTVSVDRDDPLFSLLMNLLSLDPLILAP